MTAIGPFNGWPRRIGNAGASAVEAALTLSVLFTLLFGLIEFATAFWQWNTMLFAVEQASRYVMVHNASCDTDCAETQMQNVLTTASATCADLANPPVGQFCVSATSDAGATPAPTMTLTASYGFNILTTTAFTLSNSKTVPLD